jgi:exopolysaccharide biosynthesis polyprenyl glycosylphosphotransferase
MKTTRSRLREVYKIFTASSLVLLGIIIFLFLDRESFSSRFIILSSWGLTVVLIAFSRVLIRSIQTALSIRKGVGLHRVLIVGKNAIGGIICEEIRRNPSLGYRVEKVLADFDWETLKDLKTEKGIEEIIQCDPDLSKKKINMLIRFSDIYKLEFKFIPNIFQAHTTNISIRQLAGFPLIEICKTPLDGWGKVLKRIFDLVFASLFVVIFSPVYLLIALLIRLDSPGPVIYTDYRCGYRKQKFKFFKFRSLKFELCDGELGTEEGNKFLKKLEEDTSKNTRQGGPLHKIKNDPRITRVGRFLRKYSLDELPQFFNVLKGEMSVVGYRPHMSYEVEKFNYDQQRMFYIKPGITGLAQISGRSDLDFDEEVRLDVYYMENWSLLMDVAIIFKTPFVLFRRRSVD